MATFKVELLSKTGQVIETREVRAVRNYEAIEIVQELCRAPLAKYGGYEVWRNGRKVARRFNGG